MGPFGPLRLENTGANPPTANIAMAMPLMNVAESLVCSFRIRDMIGQCSCKALSVILSGAERLIQTFTGDTAAFVPRDYALA